jgi:[ribosomal protein S18]-alanine N-acetyltransferase
MQESDCIEFVPLEESHIGAIMVIELEAYPEPWTAGMFRDEISNPRSRFQVILCRGEVIGYGGFWLVLDEAHITSVTVRDRMRGRGIGRRLMELLLDEARAAEATMATLEVRASNLRARNLYLSLGFRPVGIRKGYYPKSKEDAIVMLIEFDEESRAPVDQGEGPAPDPPTDGQPGGPAREEHG